MNNINHCDWTKMMWEKFPLLFSGKNESIQTSLIPFGFECGDGWHQFLYDLASKLEPLIRKYIEDNPDMYCECGCKRSDHYICVPDDSACLTVFQLSYYQMPWRAQKWSTWNKYKLVAKIQALRIYTRNWFRVRINRFFDMLAVRNILYKFEPCSCKHYMPMHPKASQVKEKFGTLRFYMTSSSDEMEEAIQEAERKSAVTCENCGQPGKLYNDGWVLCLCPTCAEKEGREDWSEEDESDPIGT